MPRAILYNIASLELAEEEGPCKIYLQSLIINRQCGWTHFLNKEFCQRWDGSYAPVRG